MDRHPSTIKRHRQSLRRNQQNRAARSQMRTAIKKVRDADSQDTAQSALRNAIKALDKSASSHLIHKKKAARLKSRLNHLVASRFAD